MGPPALNVDVDQLETAVPDIRMEHSQFLVLFHFSEVMHPKTFLEEIMWISHVKPFHL